MYSLRVPLIILAVLAAIALFATPIAVFIGPFEYTGNLSYAYNEGIDSIIKIDFLFDQEIGESLVVVKAPSPWSWIHEGNVLLLTGGSLVPGDSLSVDVSFNRYVLPGDRAFTGVGTTSGGELLTSTGFLGVTEMIILKIIFILNQYQLYLVGGTVALFGAEIVRTFRQKRSVVASKAKQVVGGSGLFGETNVDVSSPVIEGDQIDVTYDIDDGCGSHHCAGHRLLVIIGNDNNSTIGATLNWALKLNNVNHMIWFKEKGKGGNLKNPHIPNSVRSGWEKSEKTVSFDCCCFLEEVMIMAHGSPAGRIIHKRIVKNLPMISGGRPIRKLVLWLCNSSMDIIPDVSHLGMKYFNEYCSILVPRKCPCNCDLKLCMIRCKDPQDNHPGAYRCPDVNDPSKMYLAGWHSETGAKGKIKDIASVLGIIPKNVSQPLTSPDGRMREVTISADGKAKTELVENAEVFNGIKVRPDKNLTITEEVRNQLNAEIKSITEGADALIRKNTKGLRRGTKAYDDAVSKVENARDAQIEKRKTKAKRKRSNKLSKKSLSRSKMEKRKKTTTVTSKVMEYTGPVCKCKDRDGCLEKAV